MARFTVLSWCVPDARTGTRARRVPVYVQPTVHRDDGNGRDYGKHRHEVLVLLVPRSYGDGMTEPPRPPDEPPLPPPHVSPPSAPPPPPPSYQAAPTPSA